MLVFQEQSVRALVFSDHNFIALSQGNFQGQNFANWLFFGVFSKNKFSIWSFLVSNISYIYIKYVFFNHNIRQILHISVLILCFIFNIRLPIYKHVFFQSKTIAQNTILKYNIRIHKKYPGHQPRSNLVSQINLLPPHYSRKRLC